jgi:aryl-alcohol dehydrogenase-like predicted oxidoreductase
MQYTFLVKTGMKVSRLCLGTMNFARQTKIYNAIWESPD